MEIEYGLADGALLQRGADGFCRCRAKFAAEGNVHASRGELRPLGGGEYEFTGLPAGGPYSEPFNYVFDVHFTNAETLSAAGRPAGFMVRAASETNVPLNPFLGVSRLRLRGNVAEVHSEISASPEEAVLFYGYGNMSYCNIVTETGYSLPAFGPIKAKDMLLR